MNWQHMIMGLLLAYYANEASRIWSGRHAEVKWIKDLMAEYEVKCRLAALRAARKKLIISDRDYVTMGTPKYNYLQTFNAKIQEECDAWSMIKYGQVFGMRAEETLS